MKRKLDADFLRGESLALFLNATKGLPKHERILEILELCQQLDSFSGKVPASVETKEGMNASLQISMLEKNLDNALKAYRFRVSAGLTYRFPAVSAKRITKAWKTNRDLLPKPVGQRFSVTWRAIGPNPLSRDEIAAYKANPGLMPLGEMGALQAVLGLATAGLLHDLRRCKQPRADSPEGFCGRWFMAVKSNKDSCSAACRVRKSHQKEGSKEKRRNYMREWYRHPQVVKRRKAKNAAKKKRRGTR
jgi:hypothetical protein